MGKAFIGVGANLDPEVNIRRALRLLSEKTRLLAVSSFYRAPAEGRPGQPDFLNGVVAIESDRGPRELKFGTLRGIEEALGRSRTEDKYAPRPIDLDLLLYGALSLRNPDLQLPSPDIERRAFVAVPLAELAPQLRLPGGGEPIAQIAARLAGSSMERLDAFTASLRVQLGQ